MGSENPPKLPFLDFSNPLLKPGSADWESLKTQVREALQDYGCFGASYDKISPQMRSSVFESMQELFDIPLESKERYTAQKQSNSFVRQVPEIPLYESMAIEDADVEEEVEAVTKILWPEGNPKFTEAMHSYTEQLSELDQTIRRMIVESFGLEKYMEEHMSSTKYRLRLLKYDGLQTPDTSQLGLIPHTDKNLVTIIYQNQVDGLEVQTKDGTWIKLQLSPNSFVVVIGDSLYAWLNGRAHVPLHRVMMSESETRYSLGLFTFPKQGQIIKAPEELVDEEYPLLFKPYDYNDFVSFVSAHSGKFGANILKAFCGVDSDGSIVDDDTGPF